MRAAYSLVPGTNAAHPGTQHIARAQALGCVLTVGDPSGEVTVWPSVVVTSTVLAPVVIADTAGQATLTAVNAAKTAALTAEAKHQGALKTAATRLGALLPTLGPELAQAAKDAADYPTASAATQAAIVVRLIENTAKIAQAFAHFLVSQEVIPSTATPA